MSTAPLVSVVTPVYNGEAYLEACIESVLQQTYPHWEYVILDNASTDRTHEIATGFAARDPRIRVVRNPRTLPLMDNLNRSMRLISGESAWCKVVHADDMLLPDCLRAMVETAQAHPEVGIVGAYCQWGDRVACDGLPYPSPRTPGRELARLVLLGVTYPFLSPSALLIRSDLVRGRDPFYPGPDLHADVQVLYELLRETDFGFVHQVLTFIRRHEESATSTGAQPMLRLPLQQIDLLARYGPEFLEPGELEQRMATLLEKYYQRLARQPYGARSDEFWALHRETLARAGRPFSMRRFRAHRAERLATRITRRLVRLLS
jgi:glycosyltransferase involved in cell wall biosynthesis